MKNICKDKNYFGGIQEDSSAALYSFHGFRSQKTWKPSSETSLDIELLVHILPGRLLIPKNRYILFWCRSHH